MPQACAALLAVPQGIAANASVSTDAMETKNTIATSNDAIPLAKKPFLVENGKTVAATPINQTYVRISLIGNETLSPPNSTEMIKTTDTGNEIIRLMPAGEIVHGQILMSTEDGSEKAIVSFTQVTQN